MNLGLFFTRSILVYFAFVVKSGNLNSIVVHIGFELAVLLSVVLIRLYGRTRMQCVKVRRLCHYNEYSADNLSTFDLCKILNRVISFHKIRGYRRFLEKLSPKRLLAFRECF